MTVGPETSLEVFSKFVFKAIEANAIHDPIKRRPVKEEEHCLAEMILDVSDEDKLSLKAALGKVIPEALAQSLRRELSRVNNRIGIVPKSEGWWLQEHTKWTFRGVRMYEGFR